MSNYAQLTLFTPKDSLITGNPLKLLRGAEFDAEFSAISTAIASKLDSSAASALGANPSASVGLVAVNGSASTYTRSDGAPALSQAISPTWTGAHTFAPASGNTTFTAGTILGTDGLVGTPFYSFASDSDTGLYRFGANNLGIAAGGVQQAQIFTTGSQWLQPMLGANGLVGSPQYSFTNEPTSGLYWRGAGIVSLATAGVLNTDFASSRVLFRAGQLWAQDGVVGTPSYSFENDTDTGLYRFGINGISIAVGGIERFRVDGNSTLEVHSLGEHGFEDGTVSLPGLTFNNDIDTGIYRPGVNEVRVTVGGTAAFGAETTQVYSLLAHRFTDGSVGTPSIAFSADTDTGLYRVGANTIGVSVGGANRLEVQPGYVVLRGTGTQLLAVGDGTAALPDFTFNSDPDTGVFRVGANSLGLSAGGQARLTLDAGTATFSELIQTRTGTVGGPAFSFTGDTASGMYSGGGSNLRFATGGVKALEIDSSQKLFDKNNLELGYKQVPRSTTATTLVAADLAKCVAITAAINIPASVFSAGDAITIYNDSAGALNLTISAGTLRLAGSASTGTRSIAARGLCTIWFNVGGATPEVIASGNVS